MTTNIFFALFFLNFESKSFAFFSIYDLLRAEERLPNVVLRARPFIFTLNCPPLAFPARCTQFPRFALFLKWSKHDEQPFTQFIRD